MANLILGAELDDVNSSGGATVGPEDGDLPQDWDGSSTARYRVPGERWGFDVFLEPFSYCYAVDQSTGEETGTVESVELALYRIDRA